MNPIVTVLVDAQVKSFQRRAKTGGIAQVGSFERKGQSSQQQQATDGQSVQVLKTKATPEERAALLQAAKKAKAALMKQSSGKEGFKLAREFYKMKNQLLQKYKANQQKAAA